MTTPIRRDGGIRGGVSAAEDVTRDSDYRVIRLTSLSHLSPM